MTGADRLLQSFPGWIADPVPEAQDRAQVRWPVAAQKGAGCRSISVLIPTPFDQAEGDHCVRRNAQCAAGNTTADCQVVQGGKTTSELGEEVDLVGNK